MPNKLPLLGAGGSSGGGPPPLTANLLTAATNVAGTQFTLTFNNPVEGFSSGPEGFDLEAVGEFSFVIDYTSGDGTNTIVFDILFTTVANGQVLRLHYTPGGITAVGGAPLSPISNFPVTNNVPPPLPDDAAYRGFACLPLSRVRTVSV